MSRRDDLTAQYRSLQSPPPIQEQQPQGAPQGGKDVGSFYGGMQSRPSRSRAGGWAPIGSNSKGSSGWGAAPAPLPPTQPGHTSTWPTQQPAPQPNTNNMPHTQPASNGPGVDPQTAYQMALSSWQAQRQQAMANGQMVNMAMFPQFEEWAAQNGYGPAPQQRATPTQQPPAPPTFGQRDDNITPVEFFPDGRMRMSDGTIYDPAALGAKISGAGAAGNPGPTPVGQQPPAPGYTMPSQSFPAPQQRSAPQPQAYMPPETVTQAPTPSQASGKGGPSPSLPPGRGTQSLPQAQPGDVRSIYDRPDFAYTPQPTPLDPVFSPGARQRVADVDYAEPYRRAEEVLYGRGRQFDIGAAPSVENRNPSAVTRDLADRVRQLAQRAPRFAFGTDNSAQYQAQGMGNAWIPTSSNSYTQGKQLPPAIQKLVDMGMPIPPALLDSVTGGVSAPLNMASAFTSRGGGSLPSLQGLDRMSQDERGAFSGYLTGPIGMPEQSTIDSIGRPTSNLQGAARSRM